MKKKIIIPETINDITIGQYQKYIETPEEKIHIFTGLTKEDLKGIKQKDLDYINETIDNALNKPSEFKQTFYLDGKEFGMIPNFDNMLSDEYMDLTTYGVEPKHFHRIMAIAFRPIIDKGVGNTYLIEEYNGSEKYSELMKTAPLNYLNGFLSFFLTLQNDLLKHIS